jgi:hypothetical protein
MVTKTLKQVLDLLGFCANVARYCGVVHCRATINSRDMEGVT